MYHDSTKYKTFLKNYLACIRNLLFKVSLSACLHRVVSISHIRVMLRSSWLYTWLLGISLLFGEITVITSPWGERKTIHAILPYCVPLYLYVNIQFKFHVVWGKICFVGSIISSMPGDPVFELQLCNLMAISLRGGSDPI